MCPLHQGCDAESLVSVSIKSHVLFATAHRPTHSVRGRRKNRTRLSAPPEMKRCGSAVASLDAGGAVGCQATDSALSPWAASLCSGVLDRMSHT